VGALEQIGQKIRVIFPIHPRTRRQLALLGLKENIRFHDIQRELICPPWHPWSRSLRIFGFLKLDGLLEVCPYGLWRNSEETTVLGIPCLTLRDTTERPITIKEGTNVLVWNDTQKIVEEAFKILEGKGKKTKIPEYWDGKTQRGLSRF